MEQWLYITLLIISIIVQLSGFFGLFLVFFPGLTIIWLGQLFWAIIIGFNYGHSRIQFGFTIAIFALNTVLMVTGTLVDNLFMAAGARKKGVPWWELGLSWLAMILVSFFLTPLGGLAAALLVLFLVEYNRIKDSKQAFESTKGMAMGCGTAVIVRVAIATVMLVLWAVLLIWL